MKYMLLLSILLLCSCNKNKQTTNIERIVFNEHNKADINNIISYQFIPLETNNNSLIGNITDLKIVNNHIYINSDRDKLLVFDLSGKFITQIGNKGNGPGEYNLISNFHIDTDKNILTIADGGQARMIYYNLKNYAHINTKNIFYFVDCNWLSDGNIAWYFSRGYEYNRNRYFVKITNQSLKELNFLYPMDMELQYPVIAGSFFYTSDSNCYLNLPHTSIIFKITTQNITPAYQLDLDNHKFAPLEWLERNAAMDYSSIINTDYVSAQNVKETNNYISVCYFTKGANAYIGFYNKQTAQSYKYSISDFIKHTGLTATGIIKNTYKDSFIAILNSSVLKRNPNSKILELKSISENITEEDNPILCLLKLN